MYVCAGSQALFVRLYVQAMQHAIQTEIRNVDVRGRSRKFQRMDDGNAQSWKNQII